MNRYTSTMAIALLSAAFGTGAFAQNAPATSPNPAKTQAAPASKTKPQQHAQASVGEVRNWNAIDKNHDHLISPEEMEAALKPSGSKTSKSATSKSAPKQ